MYIDDTECTPMYIVVSEMFYILYNMHFDNERNVRNVHIASILHSCTIEFMNMYINVHFKKCFVH
jgi:hypothetical protein